jgi:tetratricopeptide (TPR) repeat protein
MALDTMGRYPDALEAHQAAAAAVPDHDPDLAASVYVEIGTVLQLQERFNAAVEANLRALSWLDRSKHPDPALRARALTNLSTDVHQLGQPERALRYAEDALAAASDAESFTRLAKAHHALSRTARQTGDVEKAIEHCDRALEIYRHIGYERDANQMLNNLGDAHYAAGSRQMAQECQERCLARAIELQDSLAEGWAATELALYALDDGDFEKAAAYSRQAQAAAESANDNYHKALSLAYEARALERLGEPAAADLRFGEACRLLRARAVLGKLAEVCVMYADVLRQRGDLDRAFAFLRMASERDFKQLADLLGRPALE